MSAYHRRGREDSEQEIASHLLPNFFFEDTTRKGSPSSSPPLQRSSPYIETHPPYSSGATWESFDFIREHTPPLAQPAPSYVPVKHNTNAPKPFPTSSYGNYGTGVDPYNKFNMNPSSSISDLFPQRRDRTQSPLLETRNSDPMPTSRHGPQRPLRTFYTSNQNNSFNSSPNPPYDQQQQKQQSSSFDNLFSKVASRPLGVFVSQENPQQHNRPRTHSYSGPGYKNRGEPEYASPPNSNPLRRQNTGGGSKRDTGGGSKRGKRKINKNHHIFDEPAHKQHRRRGQKQHPKKQKNITREYPRSQPVFDKGRASSVSTNEDSEAHKNVHSDSMEQTTISMTSSSMERQRVGYESVSSSRNSTSPTPSSTGRSSTASFNPVITTIKKNTKELNTKTTFASFIDFDNSKDDEEEDEIFIQPVIIEKVVEEKKKKKEKIKKKKLNQPNTSSSAPPTSIEKVPKKKKEKKSKKEQKDPKRKAPRSNDRKKRKKDHKKKEPVSAKESSIPSDPVDEFENLVRADFSHNKNVKKPMQFARRTLNQVIKKTMLVFSLAYSYLRFVFDWLFHILVYIIRIFCDMHKHAFHALGDHHLLFRFSFLYGFPKLSEEMLFWAPPWSPHMVWCLFACHISIWWGIVLFLIPPDIPSSSGVLQYLNASERMVIAYVLCALRTQDMGKPPIIMILVFMEMLSLFFGEYLIVQWVVFLVATFNIDQSKFNGENRGDAFTPPKLIHDDVYHFLETQSSEIWVDLDYLHSLSKQSVICNKIFRFEE